ncbi:MAG: ribosome maturation factor RimP [Steroidobacteraceae bacterium]
MAAALHARLVALIEPVLAQWGYELVDLEFGPASGGGALRIFIDKPEGVGLEDCERVSREVSALLDVEDPITTAYTLEVSSPGEDRVLRTRAHFERFVGARVHVELTAPRDGRRRYTGVLQAVADEGICLEVDRQTVSVPFREIGMARLAPSHGLAPGGSGGRADARARTSGGAARR